MIHNMSLMWMKTSVPVPPGIQRPVPHVANVTHRNKILSKATIDETEALRTVEGLYGARGAHDNTSRCSKGLAAGIVAPRAKAGTAWRLCDMYVELISKLKPHPESQTASTQQALPKMHRATPSKQARSTEQGRDSRTRTSSLGPGAGSRRHGLRQNADVGCNNPQSSQQNCSFRP